jgi:hypothetical protein
MLLLCYSVRYVVDEKALHLQYVEDQHNTREGNMWVAAGGIRAIVETSRHKSLVRRPVNRRIGKLA